VAGNHGMFHARISPTATTMPGSAFGRMVITSTAMRPEIFVLTTV
jgi:hypothetical protein